jgi:universal stress protein E
MKSGKLLVIDFGRVPQPGLAGRAREVATALRQEVFICCMFDDAELPPALPGRRKRIRRVRRKLIERGRKSLRKLLKELNDAGVTADSEVQASQSVAEDALEVVQRMSPALVLIRGECHSRFEEMTLSGHDFAIMRACPAPVWVVNPQHRSGDKIVGAIVGAHERQQDDGNAVESLDARILDHAAQLARKLGKEPHALHTFGEAGLPQEVEPAAADPDDDMGTSRYDRRMGRVFDMGEKHGLPRERIHIHEGKLVQTLEEMSEPMNADLIVLGARRRGRLSRMFAGSAAERVVQRVTADVLILKGGGPRAAEGGRPLH